ncbi:anti-sigma factor [Nocardia aurantiaca]|uniref:Regulator of SigK n=1 Tax=Nocardia aurantiaca TaxID=2675850 RepID=A0A6I3KXF9_9NOCA|nr:anti-sigma factor [Nocardia aurantiaca]MTE14367.1 hypothetical protein [Nocardia aurantiaca]
MTTTDRSDTELTDLAYPYALDAVTEEERDAIERRRCSADGRVAAEFDSTVAAVRETLAELSVLDACRPPPELEARLLRALDRAIRPDGHRRFRIGAPSGWGLLAASGLLVVMLGIGLPIATPRAGNDEPAEVSAAVIAAQPDKVTRTAAVEGGGELWIESSPSLGAVSIAFDDVAAPPFGRAYQVWLVAVGGDPRSASILEALPSRPLVTKFGPADTLAITVEPAGGSDQPTTIPIVGLNLS